MPHISEEMNAWAGDRWLCCVCGSVLRKAMGVLLNPNDSGENVYKASFVYFHNRQHEISHCKSSAAHVYSKL